MAEESDASKLSDLVLGHLSAEESLHVIESLEKDPIASSHVELNIQLLNVTATHGDAVFQEVPREHGGRGQVMEKVRGWVTDAIRTPQIAIPVALMASLFLVGVAVYGTRTYLTPPYAHLAVVDSIEFRVAVRAAGEEELAEAYRFYEAGDLRTSLRLLERHLRAYPSSPLKEYVRYSAGAVCLKSSQELMLGIVLHFDSTLVRRGMSHLAQVASVSENARLVEESRWLLAKGYLMLGQPLDAITQLNVVASIGGPRRKEAMQLMSLVRDEERGGAQ